MDTPPHGPKHQIRSWPIINAINAINAAGDEGPKARPHILFWGAALALVVGALPFSFVMVLMALALLEAIWRYGKRQAAGSPTTHGDDGPARAPEPAE